MWHSMVLKFGVAALVGLALGWSINGWRLQSDLSALSAEHSRKMQEIQAANASALADVIEQKQQAEEQLAKLDARHTEDLINAQSENNRLRDAVADGERRLRIKAVCPSAPTGAGDSSSSASVDNEGAVELDRETGRAVLDLRASLIRDRAMILALQQYVRDVCLK